MNILFASAEAYPLVKVGGLGDVAGSLPNALRAAGHDVRIVIPKYGVVKDVKKDLGTFSVAIGGAPREATLWASAIGDVPVYLIDFPSFFDRPKVYEYEDDGKRFAFFGRAVLDFLSAAHWWPDVLHANDWHSALALAFLRTSPGPDDRYRSIRSILTIHNLQHQGLFGRDLFEWTGLPSDAWNPEGVEFFGQLNFLKAGIAYADRVNTVSPTYAREIQTAEYGAGLDGLLRSRAYKLSGILNGIDTDVWNPETDALIAQRYTKSDVQRKKPQNKAALQRESGLAAEPQAPVLGLVGRATDQKGFDILTPIIPEILALGAQFVVLATGEKRYEESLSSNARAHRNFVAHLKYDESLAHRIYAGADFFLMPSRFEPCGLGQMISLRYGTVPIVRATGGLADTVTPVAGDPKGNGFTFGAYTSEALLSAVKSALDFYRARRQWGGLLRRCLALDHSWSASAREYLELYDRARRP